MSVEGILLDEATRVASSLEGGVVILEAELLAFERRKIETEARLKTANWREPVFSISGHAGARVISALFVGFKTKRNLRLTQCPA
jgi:hypothetical protein